MFPRTRLAAALVALLLVATGCTSDGAGDAPAEAVEADPATPAEKLGLRTGWGPDQGQLEKAARLTAGLSLRRLAGQVIVADWSGSGSPIKLVKRLDVGGVVAFSDNVVDASQIRRVNRTLQRRVRRPWPLMIAVDQEGGQVARVRGGVTDFPSFMSVGAADDEQLTRDVHRASGGELRRLGFNVDFAPVADVTWGPTDVAIGARSAGSDQRLVTRHSLAAAEGLRAGGVVPVFKHFPGHGSVAADSHNTLPVQRRARSQLERIDWRPFRAAIEAEESAIMVGHLNVRALDRGVPSSLSRRVVTKTLRKDLGFHGLVVTDALNMRAVTGFAKPRRVAVSALRAGADVLLMPPDPKAARDGIVKAVRKGRLDRRRLRQAAARQIALLLHHRETAGKGRAPGDSWAVSQRLSANALTSVAGPCEGTIAPDRPVPLGDPLAVANFRLAAQRAGLALGTIDYVKPPPPVKPKPPAQSKAPKKSAKKSQKSQGTALTKAQAQYRKALAQYQRDRDRWERLKPRPVLRGTRLSLAGAGSTPPGSYVVAVETPYLLGRTDAPVRIATYGNTIGAMTALVAFLQGRRPAPGRLPVPVRGVREGC